LSEDHERAKNLAKGLAQIDGLRIDMNTPATNMVFVSLKDDVKMTSEELLLNLQAKGILIGRVDKRQFRLVTHFWISDDDVRKCIKAFEAVLVS